MIDRNVLLSELQIQLDEHLAIHGESGFPAFVDEWNKNDLWRGKMVELSGGGERYPEWKAAGSDWRIDAFD